MSVWAFLPKSGLLLAARAAQAYPEATAVVAVEISFQPLFHPPFELGQQFLDIGGGSNFSILCVKQIFIGFFIVLLFVLIMLRNFLIKF